ncbi:hypothetical protein [Thermococcus sp. 21S9]|uniref:hypothetical protein n=1 Tax=Thermococcus sp. 21S9 TaxID=1638223 RepID=UPI00143A24B2|nr:hypothetical protein [Thermococcus sp. 21S9]NJE53757.1 hypothetical protein [Thermococcus sp. 21S9]
MLNVEPGEYYSIIDKLFASRIVEAVEPLGASVERIDVKIRPDGRVLFLTFEIDVVQHSLAGIVDLETIIQGILEKLIQDANASFGRLYGVTFALDGLKVRENVPKEGKKAEIKLIVSGPPEMEDALRRLGRGLMITLKDWGIPLASVTVTTDDPISPKTVSIVLRLTKRMSEAEKNTLREAVEAKAKNYAKALLPKSLEVHVKVLDPSDRNIAQVMRRAREIEKEVEMLTKDEEIRKLMEALGKSPSP